MPSPKSKKYRMALEKIDPSKEYSLKEAIHKLKEIKYTKFEGSLEGHFNMSYKNIQNIRGHCQLPHGTGKKVKILVFAKGEKAEEAKKAGADYVGDEDMIKKIEKGWIDFDFVVSTPDMMKDVGKLGPVLGKKGLMPKPKSGTVTLDISSIVKELMSGRIEYKADKGGMIHLSMGSLSFTPEKLEENTYATFKSILKNRPSDAKGEYIKSVYLSGTMSPSVRLNIKELRN